MTLFYEPLTKDDADRIHATTMEVLERAGIMVENDSVLEMFGKAGAKIDSKRKIAKIPEYVVQEGIKKVPSSFVLNSRDGKTIRIGGRRTVISSGAGASWVMDLKTGEARPATKQDVVELTRLNDALENTELCMSPIIQDVEPSLVDVHSAEAMFCNTTKPPWVCPGNGNQARYIIEMASIVAGGMEELRNRPIFLGLASPNSPLRLASNDLDITREFTTCKLPMALINCPNNGATSPISIAGTIVQTLAECLSLTLVAELFSPGNPVVIGPSPPFLDMKTANSCFGAPEGALVTASCAQMMYYYGIPSYGSITTSESIVIDAQTGWEIAWTAQLPMMAGINLVNGVGLIDAGSGMSHEKLVIDDEVFGGLRRILRGIEVSDETLAAEVIEEVGPGGHYLAQKHTRDLLNKERWFPKISNRLPLQEWKKQKMDLWQKAREEAMKILRTHRPEPLDKEKEEKIRNLVCYAEKKAAQH
jgi:trimethylamine--corrinoid protein Co-methyltransferase